MKRNKKIILVCSLLAIAGTTFLFNAMNSSCLRPDLDRPMKALQITIEEVRVTAAMDDNWWHNRYYSLYFAPYYIRSFGDYYGSYQNADSQYTDDATVEHYAIFDAGDTPTFENDLPLTWSYCLPFDQTYFSGESEIKLRVQLYRFNSNAYCYIDVPIGVSETYDTTYTAYLNWAYYGGLMEVDYKVSLI